MRKPPNPPPLGELWESSDRLEAIIGAAIGPTHKGRYLHWDKLRFLHPPGSLTREEWWLGLKFARMQMLRALPLVDREGGPFRFAMPDAAQEAAYQITRDASGAIGMGEQATNPQTRDRYIVSSLMDEAITSSQLEGAATTRRVAKEMIRTGRKPRDRSERMILNNYATIPPIRQRPDHKLTPEFVLDLHRLLTVDALDDPQATGRLRRTGEKVEVATPYNEVLHTPPHARELKKRLRLMCDFANGRIPEYFIHPVVRAILLHFWLAYDHPFVDGNGRSMGGRFCTPRPTTTTQHTSSCTTWT